MISHLRRVMVSLGLFSGLAVSFPAWGQSADRTQEAQDLFMRGRQMVKSGKCLDAIPLFEASIKAYPSRGALYNLALCEHALGRLTSAWTHFQDLLAQLAPEDERLADTKQKVAAIERSIARVRLSFVAGTPADAAVALDGAELPRDRLGTEIPLAPGQHTLIVKVAGREEKRDGFTADPGQQLTLTLSAPAAPPEVEPAPSASPPEPTAPQSTSPISLAPGLVAGGVGLAGLGVMAVTGLLAVDKKGRLEQMCPDPTRCNGNGLALASDGQALTTASTVAAVIGAVGVGASVTLLVVSGRGSKTARLGPVVWASGGGAVFEGRF